MFNLYLCVVNVKMITMSYKEVKQLRQENKLDEALLMAQQDLEAAPGDVLAKCSIAWVYDAFLKQHAYAKNGDAFLSVLDKMLSLGLGTGSSEKLLFDTLSWRILVILRLWTSADNRAVSESEAGKFADALFMRVKQIPWNKPGEGYSRILMAFNKMKDCWIGYRDFCDWWGWNNFSAEDYQERVIAEGKVMFSLVEETYLNYARGLIRDKEKARIREFLGQMEALQESHPEMMYVGYYIGKLLIELGDGSSEEWQNVLPFVRKRKSEFWVWQLMAELHQMDADKWMACMIRGINCRTKPDFLVRLYEKLAYKLEEKGLYAQTKYVVEKYLKIKETGKRKVAFGIQQIVNSPWYASCEAENPSDWMPYQKITDALLYEDLPARYVVVVHVNEGKKKMSFVYGKEQVGYASLEKLDGLAVGTVLKVRLKDDWKKEGAQHFLTCEISHEPFESDFYCQAEGRLWINDTRTYASVRAKGRQIYVPVSLVEGHQRGDNVHVAAALCFDAKKNNWNWKALNVL